MAKTLLYFIIKTELLYNLNLKLVFCRLKQCFRKAVFFFLSKYNQSILRINKMSDKTNKSKEVCFRHNTIGKFKCSFNDRLLLSCLRSHNEMSLTYIFMASFSENRRSILPGNKTTFKMKKWMKTWVGKYAFAAIKYRSPRYFKKLNKVKILSL